MAIEQGTVAPGANVGEEDRESPVRDPRLWVELEIDRRTEGECPITGLSRTGAQGTVQLTGRRCHVTIGFDGETDEDVSLYSARLDESCACTTVCGPGVTPVSLRIEDGLLVVGAYVDDRERLTEIVEALRASEDEWELRRLTTPERNALADGGLLAQVFEDIPVTDKQREAVEAAVEMGYYAEPRQATLSDLADRLGVSRSALSQRLTAVETKLVETLAAEL
jgi:hypothetical protein